MLMKLLNSPPPPLEGCAGRGRCRYGIGCIGLNGMTGMGNRWNVGEFGTKPNGGLTFAWNGGDALNVEAAR